MCDTVVATGAATKDGITILGKNSDREPNEGHQLLAIPAAEHAPGSLVDCTYIQIPQVAHTHAILLGKPFWIWGAEMGVNEHGLAIGNEALFTRVPYEKGPALIGMDLLRLALERATTAQDAVQVITNLLAAHGQGGDCGFAHKLFYHNGFVIADPHDAWVLETAGPHWAAKQVKTVYAMSNGITIGSEWDLASPDLVNYAIEQGWCKGRDDFHFGNCYSDFLYTRFSDCRGRCRRATTLLTDSLTILQAKRPEDTETADAFVTLAHCYLQIGQLDKARDCLQQAEAIQDKQLAPLHLRTAYRWLINGDLALAEGDTNLARRCYEQARDIWQATAVSTHPDLLTVQQKLADLA